jgi:outer membrane murein-binding lipoprotein Lpp
MTQTFKISTMLLPFIVPAFLTACVSQSDYDALQAKNQQLQAQNQQLQQEMQQAHEQATAHI